MIVVDTNVVVPLLIEHEMREEAVALFGYDPDWHFPDWWQIELTNVLRNYHRAKLFRVDELSEIQTRALQLWPAPNTHAIELGETLRVACESNISAYDARFIILARVFGKRLVTEDRRLRESCPDDTMGLREALELY